MVAAPKSPVFCIYETIHNGIERAPLKWGYSWEKEEKLEGMSSIFPCKSVCLVSVPLSFTLGNFATSPVRESISTPTFLSIPEPAWSSLFPCLLRRIAEHQSWFVPALKRFAFPSSLVRKRRSTASQRRSIASTSSGQLFLAPHSFQPFTLILDFGAVFQYLRRFFLAAAISDIDHSIFHHWARPRHYNKG